MTKAFITGFAGTALTADERAFLRDEQPWGASSSCAIAAIRRDPRSRRRLSRVSRLPRRARPDRPGGRPGPAPQAAAVAALSGGPRLWRALRARSRGGPARGPLGGAAHRRRSPRPRHQRRLPPVLDVPVPGVHDVIGDRAYAEDPETVIALGRAAAEGLLDGGVLPVMKHIPGHGRTQVDSHLALPVVRASRPSSRRSISAPSPPSRTCRPR